MLSGYSNPSYSSKATDASRAGKSAGLKSSMRFVSLLFPLTRVLASGGSGPTGLLPYAVRRGGFVVSLVSSQRPERPDHVQTLICHPMNDKQAILDLHIK